MMELKYSEKNRSVCHNQHHSTQTDQELRPDICVERLANNRMSPVMLLFLAAQESQFIQSLNFLPFGNLHITKSEGTAGRCVYH
jgi:hypothetical protein